ncbi:unnamed protein product (macronuclear) [Paramecium tetraurelia]|uniref:Uncharacterized protein n=1 Tax=Paramecium tetraurelia TaxID=5888 RepID=A0CQX9_PARTE|nr:uncharacterized protein GSPATT00038852001 [Paramecium tetraurelia]CAK73196.1 unnamed protein product [Paramecium tetraurelia]|eukprot:XP_001440593.1 hypothetical protein (macronuclear) [Paramecium tetraurelia strain d4-2]
MKDASDNTIHINLLKAILIWNTFRANHPKTRYSLNQANDFHEDCLAIETKQQVDNKLLIINNVAERQATQ